MKWLRRVFGWDHHWHIHEHPDQFGYWWVECRDPCEWEES